MKRDIEIKMRAGRKMYYVRPDGYIDPEIEDFILKFLEGFELVIALPESIRFDKFEIEVADTITARERIITPRSGGYWALFTIKKTDDRYTVYIYREFDIEMFYDKLCETILGKI